MYMLVDEGSTFQAPAVIDYAHGQSADSNLPPRGPPPSTSAGKLT